MAKIKVTNSYKAALVGVNDCLRATVSIYRDAVAYLIFTANETYDYWSGLTAKGKQRYLEILVHGTSKSRPIYDFDTKFYKFPSYLRRSAITDAIGIVSSYRSNLKNYEKRRYEHIVNGRPFKEKTPVLRVKHFKSPALYKGNMYERISRNEAKIKVFRNNDWNWLPVRLRNSDIKYIEKHYDETKGFSPLLVKKGRNYYLQFAFEEKVDLPVKGINNQKILAVDLGVNKSAVCSVMASDGTVLAKKFINQPREKDQMYTLLNRLKKQTKVYGNYSKKPAVWAKINGLNTQIVNDTVSQIIKFAVTNEVDCIVLEYLDIKGKKKKLRAQRLQMWAKREVARKVCHKAHSNGIRFAQVNPQNTSALAFDGSGYLMRDEGNASLCTLSTGKRYNTDLSASYNIGARYFLREFKKTIPETVWLQAEANDPTLVRRTQSTLSTLKFLVALAHLESSASGNSCGLRKTSLVEERSIT